ncbi:MAG: EamA family transporter [Pseudomonas sp.]|uniref:EamA family transporter n=1 Tax=Pseudomonas sp. TaxID=306 RepID=UPI003D09C2C2
MAIAQLLFKKAGLYANDYTELYSALILNPWLAIGLVASAGGMGCWLLALRHIPLSSAYPWTALTYVIAPLGGAVLFGEIITVKYILGMALVVAGIVVTSKGVKTG